MHVHAHTRPCLGYKRAKTLVCHDLVDLNVFAGAGHNNNESGSPREGPQFRVHDYTYDETYTQFGGTRLALQIVFS
jgi:hypothetical protein